MQLRFKLPPFRHWGAPALVAFFGWIAVLCSIDPAGDYPDALPGPGLTIDESFNVQQGVRLVEMLPALGSGLLSLREVFGDREDIGPDAPAGYHLPDHPPLGRLWIGLSHQLTRWWFPPRDHQTPFVTACARTAPATAFALLVFMLGCAATRWYGRGAGFVTAVAIVLMPRVFGHAHLAALETFMNLAYAATVLCVAARWTGPAPPKWKTACWCGLVFGLALLTKIQAVLLPVPIAIWALLYWRTKAIVPLLLWGGVGFLVFFVGWPWLWLDPLGHLMEYLGRTTQRADLYTWYFGQRYVDHSVPWHYPAVMFLTTVPVGLHLLGFCGLFCGERSAWKGPREQVVLGCIVFPLLLFSLPGVAVYDGARLFLVVFPLWAILIGRGGQLAYTWAKKKYSGRLVTVGATLFLALQAYGILKDQPCSLSYYNLSVGGLPGAERLGLETTYWGDSVTRGLLEHIVLTVPEGATIAVAPVLHEFQLAEMINQSPILRRHRVNLEPFDPQNPGQAQYLLVFRRQADLPEALRDGPAHFPKVAEVRRENVWLAALYSFEGCR